MGGGNQNENEAVFTKRIPFDPLYRHVYTHVLVNKRRYKRKKLHTQEQYNQITLLFIFLFHFSLSSTHTYTVHIVLSHTQLTEEKKTLAGQIK